MIKQHIVLKTHRNKRTKTIFHSLIKRKKNVLLKKMNFFHCNIIIFKGACTVMQKYEIDQTLMRITPHVYMY